VNGNSFAHGSSLPRGQALNSFAMRGGSLANAETTSDLNGTMTPPFSMNETREFSEVDVSCGEPIMEQENAELHVSENKGKPLKVLFLSADTGGGHRASAESLANQVGASRIAKGTRSFSPGSLLSHVHVCCDCKHHIAYFLIHHSSSILTLFLAVPKTLPRNRIRSCRRMDTHKRIPLQNTRTCLQKPLRPPTKMEILVLRE